MARRLIGDDFKGLANQVAAQLEAEHATLEQREREAEDRRRSIMVDRLIFVRVTPLVGRGVEVETCDAIPFVGHLRAVGRDYDHCVSILLYAIAEHVQRRFQLDWDSAREYATEHHRFMISAADSTLGC